MTISILICVHSKDSFHDILLLESLDSLNKQTYKDFDVFIVFDECWSQTNIVIKDQNYDFKINRLFHPKKQGLAIAKNFGLEQIKSDWVGFLDADDLYVETKLEKQVEFIKNNDVDFLGTQALNRDWRQKIFHDSCFKLGTNETNDELKNVIYNENILTHGSMLIRRKCLEELGGYRDVRGMEDWDLWKRAFAKGYKFYQIQERLYVWTYGTSVVR